MLTAFTFSLFAITFNELGDKTFFIAVVLAMRHSRRLVFAGVVAALATMTILSVLVGQALSAVVPKSYMHYAEIALFLGFGLKMLYDASRIPAQCSDKPLAAGVVEETCASEVEKEAVVAVAQSELSLKQKKPLAICLKAFALTFLAEWGDRTQIATIALAASNNAIGVTLGAILGHAACAVLAVLGGRFIAGKISERTITFIGGGLFLLFGAIALVEGA